jgi:phage protein D
MSINHRAEAEKHLANAARHLTEDVRDMRIAEVSAWIGQGHAAMARNEEQAATTADLRDAITLLRRREYATREAVATHIAKALASREPDRWKAGLDLTKALDEADCNLDDLVDARLSDDGWDPRSAYKAPAGSGGWIGYAAAKAAPERDPWAEAPDVTAEIPEPVRRVLADYLAAALLSKGDAQGVAQTITFALKAAGADLTGDIEKRITELTLGRDPSDPPF